MNRRLRVIWWTTLAFLPLYAASGVTLRARVADGAYGTDASGALIGGIALALGGLALALPAMAGRVRLGGAPAYLLAWSAAEGVAICALAAWVGGASTGWFAVGTAVSAALLIVLRPQPAAG